MPLDADLSVLIGVGGWGKPSSWVVIRRVAYVCPLWNSPPTYASAADFTTSLRILHSVWIWPFPGGGRFGEILSLVRRSNFQMNFLKWLKSVPYLDAYIIVIPQLFGQWIHFLDAFPEYLALVLQHFVALAPLLFPFLLYCTIVLLMLGHFYFLCSGHGGVASLVP